MRYAIFPLCLLLAACTSSDPDAELVGRSLVVLNSPPDVLLSGTINNWGFSVESGETTIDFFDRSGVQDDEALAVSGNTLLLTDVRLKSGVEYLLVGTLDASEHFSLYRYHDSSGDGVPDAATQTLLFSSTEPMYVTDITNAADGTTYLLDRRCQDVLVAIDTGTDGWPDQLGTTPYARSADYPRLLDSRSIRITTQNQLLAMVKDGLDLMRLPHAIFNDANADLIADAYALGPLGDKPIHLATHMVVGQDTVTARGEPGKTVEVWELNGTGGTVAILGSGVVAAGGDVTVSLSRPLTSGESIGLKYSTETAVAIRQVIVAKIPQVLELDPTTVPTGQTSTVQITGQDLTTTMVVKLVEADGTSHTLTTTFVSSTSVSVTIPSLTAEGPGTIYAEEPTQDPEVVGAVGQTLLICDP